MSESYILHGYYLANTYATSAIALNNLTSNCFTHIFDKILGMDFQKKGWLKRYLYLRNNYALMKEYDRLVNMEKKSIAPENLLYELLQPTGLLYGHPASIPISYKSLLRALRTEKLNLNEKTKIILTESFLSSALVSPRYHEINQKVDVADALLESAILIGKFYQSVYPGLNKDSKTGIFRREKKGLELTEILISQRVDTPLPDKKFWSGFFRSSQFFLDVLYFGKWLKSFTDPLHTEQIAKEHQQDRFLIFKIIVSAAYANQVLEAEEKQLLQNYLEVAHFNEETREMADKMLSEGIELKQLQLDRVQSQVMKRHLMEIAILTVCADRVINREEQIFLDMLQKELALEQDAYLSSSIAVESFMLEHWQKMNTSQEEDRLNQLGDHLLQKLFGVIQDHEDLFRQGIKAKPELQKLLDKIETEKLSAEDRNSIRTELSQVINTLPPLSSIALPKSFLTFQNLMKIFPEAYFSPKI